MKSRIDIETVVEDIFFICSNTWTTRTQEHPLSYRKHQILSNDQQYKFVKLCGLGHLYKPTEGGEETTKTGKFNNKKSPPMSKKSQMRVC